MFSLKEVHGRVFGRALSGGIKGGAAGAAASLATGAAVVYTAPAWLPFLGGAAVVSMTAVAGWSAAGSLVGAATSGVRAYVSHRREEAAFAKAFAPTQRRRSP